MLPYPWQLERMEVLKVSLLSEKNKITTEKFTLKYTIFSLPLWKCLHTFYCLLIWKVPVVYITKSMPTELSE